MQVSYDISPSEHLEMVRAVHISPTRRTIRVCLGLLGFFLAIFSIRYVDTALGLLLAAIFAMFTTSQFFLPLIIHRRVYYGNISFFSTRTVTFDDDGVRADSEMGHFEKKWSSYRNYRETKNLFLLFQTKDSAGIVPKKAFLSAEAIADFRALLNSKIGSTEA
jgi:hypothetical protein